MQTYYQREIYSLSTHDTLIRIGKRIAERKFIYYDSTTEQITFHLKINIALEIAIIFYLVLSKDWFIFVLFWKEKTQ